MKILNQDRTWEYDFDTFNGDYVSYDEVIRDGKFFGYNLILNGEYLLGTFDTIDEIVKEMRKIKSLDRKSKMKYYKVSGYIKPVMEKESLYQALVRSCKEDEKVAWTITIIAIVLMLIIYIV